MRYIILLNFIFLTSFTQAQNLTQVKSELTEYYHGSHQLRQKVNEFSQINISLTNNVNNLEVESNRLKETETKLELIAKESGTTTDKLKNLVKENGIIIQEKKQLLQSDLVQSIISIIFDSDRDESSNLNEREINRLVLRLKNLPTVKVNTDLLKLKATANHGSIRRIVSLVQDLDNKDIPKEDRIFIVKDDEEVGEFINE